MNTFNGKTYNGPNARKYVVYAYPTSTTATKYGRDKQGCWVVNVYEDYATGLPVNVAAFATKDEAFAYAVTLSIPWWALPRKYDEDSIAKAEATEYPAIPLSPLPRVKN